MNKIFFILLLVICQNGKIFGQKIEYYKELDLYKGTTKIESLNNEGLNQPIISTTDLDNDGLKDLVIFDKISSQIQTYIYDQKIKDYIYNNKYQQTYSTIFPKRNIKLEDLDRDGLEDIIGYDNYNTISYHKAKRNQKGEIEYLKPKEIFAKSSVSDSIYIQIPPSIVPCLYDFDNDGDIDILYMSFLKEIKYYENVSVDKNLPLDSIEFKINTKSFSNFYINIYDTSSKPLLSFGQRHSVIQSLWHIDVNNDGQIDLATGDENYNNTSLGLNKGTLDSARIIQNDTFFPKYNSPIDFYFSQGYWIDVNNDSKKDIISSLLSNFDVSEFITTNKVMYKNNDIDVANVYLNTGIYISDKTNGNTDSFAKQTKPFLSHTNIDFGTSSNPVFFDYNHDGLMDILVSNFYRIEDTVFSNISLLRNEGTKTKAIYKLITDDYLSFKGKNYIDIQLSVGNLNKDQYKDLLINYKKTLKNTDTFLTEIYYGSNDTSLDGINTNFKKINISNTQRKYDIKMVLIDLNKDSLDDLIVGSAYNIRAHKNTGNSEAPNFNEIVNDSLISNSQISEFLINASFRPFIINDTNNNPRLMFNYYTPNQFEEKIANADFLGIDVFKEKALIMSYDVMPFFRKWNTKIDASNIDGDNKQELIVGNLMGGIQFLKITDYSNDNSNISNNNNNNNSFYNIYPNPTSDNLTIELEGFKNDINVEIYDLLGKLEYSNIINKKTTINIESLTEGMYFIKFSSDKYVYGIKKFFKK